MLSSLQSPQQSGARFFCGLRRMMTSRAASLIFVLRRLVAVMICQRKRWIEPGGRGGAPSPGSVIAPLQAFAYNEAVT